jgi:hypothetical protein
LPQVLGGGALAPEHRGRRVAGGEVAEQALRLSGEALLEVPGGVAHGFPAAGDRLQGDDVAQNLLDEGGGGQVAAPDRPLREAGGLPHRVHRRGHVLGGGGVAHGERAGLGEERIVEVVLRPRPGSHLEGSGGPARERGRGVFPAGSYDFGVGHGEASLYGGSGGLAADRSQPRPTRSPKR